ncbi:eukaryotic translation initiation factor 2A-like [Dendronephthya gigantea]|uniref:eukaryotic translation initiation factor 2A-like n=1 Tax=Dendronephthya gigantea TaxID=151771 RepID=UPI00106B21D4|nr:eukaryotic translation initiation factor 2A-like [Dendronephthya gigantea]
MAANVEIQNLPAPPHLAIRASDGVSVKKLVNTSLCDVPNFKKDDSKPSRILEFSSDGKMMAWCNSESINVFDFDSGRRLPSIPREKTNLLSFSPQNKYLVTWEPLIVKRDGPKEKDTLEIWEVETGNCVKGFCIKKRENSSLKWSEDEMICAKCVTNEVHFYEDGNFASFVNKLRLQGVSCIEIAPGPSPYKIAAYVRGTKAAPSYVRLYQYPNFDIPLANKSFFKAEKANILWNKKGTAALILTSTEVDHTGGSYYGEQSLQYISTNGDSNVVILPKKGPIYAIDWNPNSSQFCVVYGYMPAKATIFNLKCESVFDFGTGPRNAAYFNAHGSILCLAGFGNLRGNMEFWDVKRFKEINKLQASDATVFEWCPDGQHFMTATTSPRLREGNGYKIWHYNGNCVHEESVYELWQVSWQPRAEGVFPEVPITTPKNAQKPKAKVEAYRPPSARGTPVTTTKLHEIEPPENQKSRELSASALKNKKKREAKARSKKENESKETGSNMVVETPPAAAPVPATENDKKLRNLRKKLKQIEDLKGQKKAGKKLEKNQEDKINSEESVREELRKLELI